MVDLHTHSTFSDGTFTPTELAAAAARAGLTAIALTDHDTIAGNEELLAAAADLPLRAMAGVEISAQYENPETDGRSGELHILGYFPRWSSATAAAIAPLDAMRQSREERNPQIMARLQDLGFDVTYDEVRALAGNDIVGRPHIAALLVRKGIVREPQQAFDLYIGRHRPAYVPQRVFTPERVLRLIAEADGLAVLAHPSSLKIESAPVLRAFVSQLAAWGLKGIEAYYCTYNVNDSNTYTKLARENNLVVTGGTDFHGANKPDIKLGRGFGGLNTPDACFDSLLNAVPGLCTPTDLNVT